MHIVVLKYNESYIYRVRHKYSLRNCQIGRHSAPPPFLQEVLKITTDRVQPLKVSLRIQNLKVRITVIVKL